MKTEKLERQQKLLSLLRDKELSTQDDLVNGMKNAGFEVTQATISRDIKDLGIIKVMTPGGIQKYVSMGRTGETISGRLMKIYAESVLSVEPASSLIVIKTLPGMAQACASAIDSMRITDLVGTIAGDDTVFVATRSAEIAQSLATSLAHLISPHSTPSEI